MGADAWITVAVTAAAVVLMTRDWLEPALALGAALGVLVLAGAVTPRGALAGFSSTAVAIVALLLVLAGTLEGSAFVTRLGELVFGSRGGRMGLYRSLGPVAVLSAFLSNTAVVATLIPAVREWARSVDETPTKYLIPLSFAAILGGTATLIGTSTNLVVHGMLVEQGGPGLGMFELVPVAVPLAVVGIAYLAAVAYGLLPARKDPLERAAENPREYMARLRVLPGSRFVGEPVSDVGGATGLFVAGLERGARLEVPPEPDAPVRTGDVLIVAGVMETIVDLAASEGLSPATAEVDGEALLPGERHNLVEAVVSPSAPFVGENIREAGFRGHYDAVVLAVHRHGERISGSVGDVRIRPGDTLLLLAGSAFLDRWRHSHDFYLISDVGPVERPLRPADWVEPAVLGGVVALPALGIMPLLEAAILGVLAILVTGRLRPPDLWTKLDWSVLVTIAAAIGVGNAFVQSGLAAALGQGITAAGGAFGAGGMIFAVLLGTTFLTEIITNVAAAALMLPIATAAAGAGGVELHAMAVAVAVGASGAFLTPVSYQTNTMVAGAGSYTFKEFFRVGFPLKLLFVVVAGAVIPLVW